MQGVFTLLFAYQRIDRKPMTDLPPLIKDTETLRTLCDALSAEEFIAIDTEFLRENTYYSQLCLIQVAAGAVSYTHLTLPTICSV